LENVNLDVKNPKSKSELTYTQPEKLIASLVAREKRVLNLFEEIESIISASALN